jgi:hypothetical protein
MPAGKFADSRYVGEKRPTHGRIVQEAMDPDSDIAGIRLKCPTVANAQNHIQVG